MNNGSATGSEQTESRIGGGVSGEIDHELTDLVRKAKEYGLWNQMKEISYRNEEFHQMFKEDLQQAVSREEKLRSSEEKLRSREEKLRSREEKLRQRSLAALFEEKRVLSNRTDSHPHVKKLKHSPAEIKRVQYNFNDDIFIPTDSEYTIPHDMSVESETDVQRFIIGILESILRAIAKDVTAVQNRRITGVECDILLLHGKNRIPFAAVEIKKNGAKEFVEAIFEDGEEVDEQLRGKVQGEHLNQLEVIQFFGFGKVFGAISDGNHSMITCTASFSPEDFPSSDEMSSKKRSAESMNEGSKKKSPGKAVKFHQKPTGLGLMKHLRPRTKPSKLLYCSGYADCEKDGGWVPTVKLLTHLVRLAVKTVDPDRFCREIELGTNLPARVIKLSDNSDVFAHSTVKFDKKPDLWACLLRKKDVGEILLFKNLGLGANGDCCLATTRCRNWFCAVKFFAERDSALECATKEQLRWNTIYNELPQSRVVTFPTTTVSENGDNTDKTDACLCMPYLIPIDDDEARQNALNDGSIRDCLVEFAAKGYLHNEVKWRHLGLFRSQSKSQSASATKVYFCDHGNLRERKEEESNACWESLSIEWMENSMTALAQRAREERKEEAACYRPIPLP